MVTPEAIINVILFFIFLGFWATVFIIFYHLTRFGVGTLPKKLAAIFLLGSVFLFCASLVLYQQVDFSFIPK